MPWFAVNLPPMFFEPGSCEYFFASAAKIAAGLELGVDLLRERLLVLADEDLLDRPRGGLLVLRLVRRVVGGDLGSRDRGALRDLLVDLLLEQLLLQVRPDLRVGEALLLDAGLVLLLAAAEVLAS